jgi:SpoVK/Ycf46/Vps4 family AAA+-type ATPase
VNDSVLNALLAALKANENDIDLLLHIADHLSKQSVAEEALSYYQRVLTLSPGYIEALQGAASSARNCDKAELADGYQNVLNSLQAKTPAMAPQEESPVKRVRGAQLKVVDGGLRDNETWIDVEDSSVYLDDVGGMEEVKRLLNLSFLAPLKNPEIMKAYGKSVSGGLLLYGPPGCGKTFIARALAGELGAKFISVGLHDILDMYVGESERKLHELFESARRHTPAVLFFDELDAIGQKRSQLRNSGTRSLVNQLLSEMDSLNSDNTDLFILAATNHPWDIDSALRRPGRFDRTVPVFPPDHPGREAILNNHLKNKPTGSIDIQTIADKTEKFSGADLCYLCDVAIENAIEKSMNSGNIEPLQTDDLVTALPQVKPSTLSWFETARNFAMFANEGGTYDALLDYIRKHKL